MKVHTEIYERLKAYGQTQLLAFWDTLSESEQRNLLMEIAETDFDTMQMLYRKAREASAGDAQRPFEKLEPLPCLDTTVLTEQEKILLGRSGMDGIRNGELAALTMAGGQGTRLGHNGPKGTFDIGLPSRASLFEIQCRGLQKVSEKAGRPIDWYIMTSTINYADTVCFFEEHGFFGYPKEKIHFFPQTMIPAVTEDGKLQLESPAHILRSPNGNGGMFVSLKQSGCLDALERQGVRYIFVCGIDNCLVKMCDPLFFGALRTANGNVQASAKSYIKRDPGEKAGIFCRMDGKPGVLEYTEIPQEYAEMKNPDGQWTYGDTNVLNYIFSVEAVRCLAEAEIPYHVAVKKLTYLDAATGQSVTVPQGYKFELFLFDTFLCLDDLQVVRIERTEEFAPVKNPSGIDSAESARALYLDYEAKQPRKWEEKI